MANNKKDKSDIWRRILAGILAALTIISVSATCIYAIVRTING